MSTGMERLAALRAQAGNERPQGTAPPQQPGAYSYEMNPVSTPAANVNDSAPSDDFYGEVSNIQDLIDQYTGNVRKIQDLQARALDVIGDGSGQNSIAMLDDQVAQTRELGTTIKKRIEALKKRPIAAGQQGKGQKQQVSVVAKRFVSSLQSYNQVEKEYRQKQRSRVERQFKIVKPDATEDEVRAVVDDNRGTGGQIFADAITSSQRYGQSRQAYQEVQSRHEDIQKIERTMEEVAQLISDMSVLVAQQDDVINDIEVTAGKIEEETGKGAEHTAAAKESARKARKKRIIIFWLVVLLVLIIAGIIAAVVATKK